MRYSTRLYGAPYGRDGERSEDTQRPMERAAGILHPGQTLDCFDAANDPHQRRPLRRFHHSMEHGVDEVELDTEHDPPADCADAGCSTHPNSETADALDALRDKAKERDTEGYTLDALRMLARDYRDWQTGAWETTPERADEVLSGRALEAVSIAEDAGLRDIAQGVRELFGGEVAP